MLVTFGRSVEPSVLMQWTLLMSTQCVALPCIFVLVFLLQYNQQSEEKSGLQCWSYSWRHKVHSICCILLEHSAFSQFLGCRLHHVPFIKGIRNAHWGVASHILISVRLLIINTQIVAVLFVLLKGLVAIQIIFLCFQKIFLFTNSFTTQLE